MNSIKIYQTKKETHDWDFPVKFFFKCKTAYCYTILISDQILLKLKLECGVDYYLYLQCKGTKLSMQLEKGVLKAFMNDTVYMEFRGNFTLEKY